LTSVVSFAMPGGVLGGGAGAGVAVGGTAGLFGAAGLVGSVAD
jgi:hypothetical protein